MFYSFDTSGITDSKIADMNPNASVAFFFQRSHAFPFCFVCSTLPPPIRFYCCHDQARWTWLVLRGDGRGVRLVRLEGNTDGDGLPVHRCIVSFSAQSSIINRSQRANISVHLLLSWKEIKTENYWWETIAWHLFSTIIKIKDAFASTLVHYYCMSRFLSSFAFENTKEIV